MTTKTAGRKAMIEIDRRGPLPEKGQVARIGRDYFRVVSFQPPPDLFRVTGAGFTYPEDVPVCQRVREGAPVGEPLPFPVFGEVAWLPEMPAVERRAPRSREESFLASGLDGGER